VIVQQEKAGGTARQTEYDVVVIFDKDVRSLRITTRNGEYFEPLPEQRLGGISHFHPCGVSGPRVVEPGIMM
jgi:hypothetical protein